MGGGLFVEGSVSERCLMKIKSRDTVDCIREKIECDASFGSHST